MEITPVINCDSLVCVNEKLKKLATFSPRVKHVHIDVGVPPVSSVRTPLFSKPVTQYAKTFSFVLHCMVPERLFFSRSHRVKGVGLVYYHASQITQKEKFEARVREWKKSGVETGVAITLQDPRSSFVLPRGVRHILVLAVKPGKSNQKFNTRAYSLISFLKGKFPRAILTVDGGITPVIARKLRARGVSRVTSGGYIWSGSSPEKKYQELKQKS
ncbi:MAG: hypothetical protein M1320_01115 [Patescibacteria group bacterium]|nr:hypothetical protein [Patescibacteria group bacterium]